VRFVLGVSAFLLPTFFMGITTPAFARAVAFERENSGAWLARLYGWNTLGAAIGALTTAYVLVPKLGLVLSMVLATAINFVALAAYRASVAVPVPAPVSSGGRTH
jgi:predicted membrane-bound spermidine synthase